MTVGSDRPGEVTRLLREAAEDRLASDELLPLVYDELRALARARIAHERPGQTLQATALVHEAWLRVAGEDEAGWNGKGHFFGAAARAMRRILVEQARRKGRIKHGGGHERVELEDAEPPLAGGEAVEEPDGLDVLAVEEALARLEQQDPRKGRLVELRYFAGLTVEETAAVLGVSVGTVERDWRFVRAWLQTELDADA